MRLNFMKTCLLACLFICLGALSYGQSLGDIARAERQKRQNQNPQAAPKIITNEDLPKHGLDQDESAANTQRDNAPSRPLGSKPAEQWKADIAAQRNTVTSLQGQIDSLNRTIHFANGGCVYHCVEHNENQLKKQDEVQQLQEKLSQAKSKLDEMQDQAQREGFGNSVYEP